MTTKLEEQIFNHLKQQGRRNEIFSGNRAIEPHGMPIAPPEATIDSTSLNEESPYSIERGDFSARPSSSITKDMPLVEREMSYDAKQLLDQVLAQKDFIQNDDLVTVGDLGRFIFGMPQGLPEEGLTKSQKWLMNRLNDIGDIPASNATAIKRLAEFLSPFTNELINRTGKLSEKLGEVPGAIQNIPAGILKIIDESLESGTLEPIGDKWKREEVIRSFKAKPKTWI
tara:strand:- start:217 stop:897 length:681 start_codon:yes stop_codon:yes gene_type:complete